MAVLQTLRNKAAGLLIGVLGLALVAFILSDFFSSGNAFFNKFKDKAFVVGGDVVSTKKYQQRIEEQENFYRNAFGQSPSGEEAVKNREALYQTMVEEMLLEQAAEKLGLTVTSEELTSLVTGANISPVLLYDQEISPLFKNPNTQTFDVNALTSFLGTVQMDISKVPVEQRNQLYVAKEIWSYIERKIKNNRLKEKYGMLMARTAMANNVEVKAVQEDTKYSSNIAYVVEKYTALSDSSVQVTDKEIQDLYNKRKSNYTLDFEYRKVSYFIKDVIPSDEDYAIVEKEMNDAKAKLATTDNPALVVSEYSVNPFVDAFVAEQTLSPDIKNFVSSAQVGDIYGPVRNEQAFVMYKFLDKKVASDSVQLQSIALPQGMDDKFVATLADSLMNVIKGGKSFADLANELMPGSNGGDMGKYTEYMLAGAGIAKQCFDANVGDVIKLSIGGRQQLIRIASKTAAVPQVKLAAIAKPVLISDKTLNGIDNELNKFVSENSTLELFNKNAESKGYSLVKDAMVTASDVSLPGAADSRQIVHWAFNEKTGTIKKFDLADKRVVTIISSEIEDGYWPLSELSNVLKAELIKDKKAEKMIADLKAKNLPSLDAYAQTLGEKVDTVNFVNFQTQGMQVGYEPIFNVYSKVGTVDKLTAPLKGESGVYAISVLEKRDDSAKFNEEMTKNMILQRNLSGRISQILNCLREKTKVEDNRVKFW